MGKLTKSHLTEGAVWLSIAVIVFGFSFEFNQPLEIYSVGATGWPRGGLGLMLLVTVGNFYYQYKHGSAIQTGRVGIADEDETGSYDNISAIVKVLAVLGTPFLFALSLKPVGFYFATPFFIALIIVIFGERRWKWILGITALLYALLLGLFMVVLNAPLPQGNVSPFYDYSAFILRLNNDLQQLW